MPHRATCIHKMGQEKSLPSRCNSIHNYNYQLTGSSHRHHRHHHHHHNGGTTTLSSAISSVSLAPSARSSTSTIQTNVSRATCKSVQRQTKYLKEQLYIKSYLDLEDQDRAAKKVFQQKTKTGIRNYTPKILGEKQLNDDDDNNLGSSGGITSAGTTKSNTNTLSSQGCSSATSTLRRDPDAWI